jgi:urease accessory protein
MRSVAPSCSARRMSGRDSFVTREGAAGRSAKAALVFAAGGGRSVLTRQHVPYPFHITRTFQLDRARPDIATLYLQSASGGFYRADELTLEIEVRQGAHAHVTTQAATMVHDTGHQPARQRTCLRIEDGGFLAYGPDPLVLFPGAAIRNETTITVAPEARAIVVDGFAVHDPEERGRPFTMIEQRLDIVGTDGRSKVRERGTLRGDDFLDRRSPLGPFKASGSMLVLAPMAVLPVGPDLQRACDSVGCLSGVTPLPTGAGLLLRCLAYNGGDLRRGLEAAFPIAFKALVGIEPAPLRK